MTRIILSLLLFATIAGCSSSPTAPPSGGGNNGSLVVPDTINFGTVSTGQTHDTAISLSNASSDTLTITGDALSSPIAHDTNFTHSVALAPKGGFVIVHLQFDPSSLGINTATDSIHYKIMGTSYSALVTLTGEGEGFAANIGNLVAANPISFGMLPIGQWHDTTVLLVNNGTGPLTITSSTLSSSEGQDTNFAQPMLIPAGGYQMVHVQFNPSSMGLRMVMDTLHYTTAGTTKVTVITMNATGAQTTTTPGPGSTYTFAVDTNGIKLPSSTYTVISNSLTFQGKSNVVELRDDTGGTAYYHVESNGDLSVYIDFNANSALPIPVPPAWLTIPLGSKQKTTAVLYDTNITYNGFPATIQAVDTGAYQGSSQVPAAGKTFATDQGSLSVALTVSSFGFSVFSYETVVNIWYAKQIAFYPKRRDVSQTAGSTLIGVPAISTTTNYLLTSYSIK